MAVTGLRLRTTGRRIVLAFAAILALFGIALAVIVASLHRIGDAERQVAHLDHAKHAGHQVAALAREQYIHQAHTLLVWDDSHLGHYAEVAEKARAAAEHLIAMVSTDERAQAEAIAGLVAESDRRFRAEVVPAIASDDRSRANVLHESTQAVVVDVVARNERLNAELEAKSAEGRDRAETIRNRATLVVVASFVLAILLASAVGAYLLRSITRPMAVLRRGVERVGEGDLEHVIDLPGHDEFAQLASSFNQMTRDLAAHHTELLEAHRLASIGQVASGVAHEINNPLGVILGYTRILRGDVTLKDRDELPIIEDEVRQAQRSVAGLLDLARPVQLHEVVVDIGEIVKEAVARLRESGQAGDVPIVIEEAAQICVLADETKLRQIVVNLLINAVEAARDGATISSEVRIDWATTATGARIDVSDRGPGLAAEAIPRLFEPFFSTKAKGHGLGLAIARTLARAHQGELELANRPDGAGARARLTLPRSRVVRT
jgi:two-component system, NtrC family, sensor kinase